MYRCVYVCIYVLTVFLYGISNEHTHLGRILLHGLIKLSLLYFVYVYTCVYVYACSPYVNKVFHIIPCM